MCRSHPWRCKFRRLPHGRRGTDAGAIVEELLFFTVMAKPSLKIPPPRFDTLPATILLLRVKIPSVPT